METIRFPAKIFRGPEGTYVATCAATLGCLGKGPTSRSALDALHKAVHEFLQPALKHCSQVEISLRVVASGIHASPPSQRRPTAMPVGTRNGTYGNEDRYRHNSD